jgi:hypothetical protein
LSLYLEKMAFWPAYPLTWYAYFYSALGGATLIEEDLL